VFIAICESTYIWHPVHEYAPVVPCIIFIHFRMYVAIGKLDYMTM